MVQDEKYKGALMSLNAILVLCRKFALDGETKELSTVLDIAEYLPLLLLDANDRTSDFREQLSDLAHRFPAFGHALKQFDSAR